jgi:hypothetical protein
MNPSCFLVLLLRQTLDALGPPYRLSNDKQDLIGRTHPLKAAADGERDRERLIDAALMAVAAWRALSNQAGLTAPSDRTNLWPLQARTH